MRQNPSNVGIARVHLIGCTLSIFFLSACSVFNSTTDPFLAKMQTTNSGNLTGTAQNESEAFYNYLVGEIAFGEQDFEMAEKSFAKASQLIDLPSATIHEKLAEMYVRSGKLDKAMNESQRLLEAEPDNVEYLLLHAGILESSEQIEQAIKIYNNVIIRFPERGEVYVLLANAHVKKGDVAGAEAVLKKGEEKNSSNLLVLYNLGRIAESQKKKDQALDYYLKTFEKDPQNSLVVADVLRCLVEAQKYEEAEKFAQRVLENQPQNVLARKLLSQLLLGKSEVTEALEQFSTLENMQAELGIDTRMKIARIQMNAQNHPEAIRQLLLVLAEDPNHAEARFYLASLYVAAGRVTDAFTEIQKIESDDKLYTRAKIFEGFLWRQTGDSKKAEECFLEAHQKQPNDVKIIYYLIAALKDRKKYDDANEYFVKAHIVKPKNERLLFQHAVLLHEMGRSEESLERMQEVLVINPENADALNFIAFAMAEKEDQLEQALQKSERALQITPNEPYYLDTLGWIYFKMKNYTAAEKFTAQALQQLPDDPEINEHFADILLATGDKKRSYEYYKKVQELIQVQDKADVDVNKSRRIKNKLEALELSVDSQ